MFEIFKQVASGGMDKDLEKGFEALQLQEIDQAAGYFSEAIKKDAEASKQRLFNLVDEFWQTNDHALALALGEALIRINCIDHVVLNKLGNAARKLGDLARAEDLYGKSLSFKFSYELPSYNLSAILAGIELFDQQVGDLLQPLLRKRDFIYPDYRFEVPMVETLKVLLFGSAEKAEAAGEEKVTKKIEEHLYKQVNDNWEQKGIGKEQFHKHLYNLALFYLKHKDFKKSFEFFTVLKTENSMIPYSDMLYALAMFKNGKRKQALPHLHKLAEENPNNRLIHFNLAMAYKQDNNILLCQKHLIKTAAVLEKTEGKLEFEAIATEARRYAQTRNYAKAHELYQYIENETERLSIRKEMAEVYANEDDYAKASEFCLELMKVPQEREFAKKLLAKIFQKEVLLGDSFLKTNKPSAAAQCFERALKIQREPEILLKAASAYKKLKNMPKAEAYRDEAERLKNKKDQMKTDEEIQNLIRQGKEASQGGDFNGGITFLEQAYQLGKNEEAYQLLRQLYSKLNRKRALLSLESSWKTKGTV